MSVVLEFPEAPQFEFLIDLQGQSLYQKWLELGNVGTESDFLNWLKLDSAAIFGTGTTGYLPKFTSAGVLGDSNFFDAGAQSQIRAGQLYVGNPNTTNTNNVYIEIGSTTTPPNIQGAKAGVGTATLHLQRDGGNVVVNVGTDNGVDKLQVNGSGLFTGKLKALCPTYANDAAATADATLLSGQFYKLTGSKQVYQKD